MVEEGGGNLHDTELFVFLSFTANFVFYFNTAHRSLKQQGSHTAQSFHTAKSCQHKPIVSFMQHGFPSFWPSSAIISPTKHTFSTSHRKTQAELLWHRSCHPQSAVWLSDWFDQVCKDSLEKHESLYWQKRRFIKLSHEPLRAGYSHHRFMINNKILMGNHKWLLSRLLNKPSQSICYESKLSTAYSV